MKSLNELKELRDEYKKNLEMNDTNIKTRIVVGMATCGISAGARPVLQTIIEEINNNNLKDVQVVQTGCIGICEYEPLVEVYKSDEEKTTYIYVDSYKARKIIEEHIIKGNVIDEYTIGSEERR